MPTHTSDSKTDIELCPLRDFMIWSARRHLLQAVASQRSFPHTHLHPPYFRLGWLPCPLSLPPWMLSSVPVTSQEGDAGLGPASGSRLG